MMKKIFILFSFILLANYIYSQIDPQALKILDKFSSAALAAPSVSMKFLLITTNELDNTTDTLNGSIIMTKDRYKLEMPDNITWFNGDASWNYLIAEKEVTITKPDKKDESFLNRPATIFTLYRKGYKNRFIEETGNSNIIDLYPEDIKSDLVRIRLSLGKSASDLKGAEYKRKDGIVVYLVVNEYNLRQKPDQSTFTFDPQKYKGIEIIDMR
jgi:outer membrane lipoprotein carrier protein